jgi:hypothetical protein
MSRNRDLHTLPLSVQFTANGMVGTTNHSSWLQLQIANGEFDNDGRPALSGQQLSESRA